MLKTIYFKSDLKRLCREPMMAMMFLTPLIITIVFKLMIIFLVPLMKYYISFDIAPYYHYILAFILVLNPGILGIVMGFMMIDDKDAKIFELISITPLGKRGYMFMRLTFIFVCTFIYTQYNYFMLNIFSVSYLILIYISLLLSIYGSLIGMLLFIITTDKVKGLTYAKAFNILMLFALGDLISIKWLRVFSSLFPPFWITKIIAKPNNLMVMLSGLIVHVVWFYIISFISRKFINDNR